MIPKSQVSQVAVGRDLCLQIGGGHRGIIRGACCDEIEKSLLLYWVWLNRRNGWRIAYTQTFLSASLSQTDLDVLVVRQSLSGTFLPHVPRASFSSNRKDRISSSPHHPLPSSS